MGSSRRTEHLGLNQWDGEDSSEREDFNRDNRLVDEAAGTLAEQARAASDQAGAAEELASGLLKELEAHVDDDQIHMGQGEKARLQAVEFLSGSYSGTGSAERVVELGFRPGFGLVWCATMSATVSGTGGTQVYADTLSGEAASACCETTASGFRVLQSGAATDGFIPRLNESGKQYLYVVWR